MIKFQSLLSAIVGSIIFGSFAAHATVLCAPQGDVENSFLEGGAVVVRNACEPGETQVRPFAFLPNGELVESVPRGKQTQVANGYSVVVGHDYNSSAGGAVSIQAGSDFSSTVAGSALNSVGEDSTENIAGDLNVETGGETNFNSGKNFQVRANGDIVIGNRRSRIVLRRNGSVLVTGTRVNVKGGGRVIQLKGGKISQN